MVTRPNRVIGETGAHQDGGRLRRWFVSFVQAGVAPSDSEADRRQKAILTLGVVLKVSCCPMWVVSYGLLGYDVAAAAPLAYMVLSAISTGRFLATKAFSPYSTRQIALMLLLPAAMQYALGGYVAGSAVILWSLLAPLMAFLFLGARRAIPWITAFLVLAAGSSVLEQMGIPKAAATPTGLREAFFVLNVAAVGLIVCATVWYFAVRLEEEQARSEALLFNVLPQPIIERLKRGEEPIADTHAAVTVLFADLVGFTQLSTQVEPAQMVQMLNRIFSAFDALAQHYGLEKIKTTGDGYHVVAGLPVAREDHAEAALRMALAMRATVQQLADESGWPLALRIGIDSGGPVIAGVIGTRKYVYEVWGDVVNTASRMESSCLPDTIHVTEGTYLRLRGAYAFDQLPPMQVKGKGLMQTYLLVGEHADREAARGEVLTLQRAPEPVPELT
jgi:guanylate cyclase